MIYYLEMFLLYLYKPHILFDMHSENVYNELVFLHVKILKFTLCLHFVLLLSLTILRMFFVVKNHKVSISNLHTLVFYDLSVKNSL